MQLISNRNNGENWLLSYFKKGKVLEKIFIDLLELPRNEDLYSDMATLNNFKYYLVKDKLK